jgi:hypothetical protein
MDRKIVEYLVMGKPHRWIKRQLGVGAGRLAKVQALAQAHGYLSGQAMPAYPQALFADRVDRRSEQRSDVDELLLARKDWIQERLSAGWKAITVFEELQLAVTRSSFYRFLERHGLDGVSREASVVRVVPEIVHCPGEALILDWGKLCTVTDPTSGAKRTLWVMIAVLGFSRYLCARVVAQRCEDNAECHRIDLARGRRRHLASDLGQSQMLCTHCVSLRAGAESGVRALCRTLWVHH